MTTATETIIKVLKVEDTRQYEEIADDVWVPIPGSGVEHECYRCGRIHEVHATVELDSGATVVVGTGCMKQDDAVAIKAVKNAASRAKTIAKLTAKLASEKANDQKVAGAWQAVEALPVPEITEAVRESSGRMVLYCGDAWQYCDKRTPDYERQVIYTWKHNRVQEILKPQGLRVFRGSIVHDLEKRLARLQRAAA